MLLLDFVVNRMSHLSDILQICVTQGWSDVMWAVKSSIHTHLIFAMTWWDFIVKCRHNSFYFCSSQHSICFAWASDMRGPAVTPACQTHDLFFTFHAIYMPFMMRFTRFTQLPMLSLENVLALFDEVTIIAQQICRWLSFIAKVLVWAICKR